MPTHLTPHYTARFDSTASPLLRFRGRRELKTRKIKRKISLRLKHLFLSFLLLGTLFFAGQQICLFLFSWNQLNIRQIEVHCKEPEIQAKVENLLKGKNLGNILLLNIYQLQDTLESHSQVEKAFIKKIMPSTLRIDITERIPAALLEKNTSLVMIDKKGREMGHFDASKAINLPLFFDDNQFKRGRNEKLELAWRCLDSLSALEKKSIEVLDLTEYENIKLKLKGSSTWLILGNNDFSEKIQTYLQKHTHLKKYEPLEYIDLRFQDRFIIKSQEGLVANNKFNPKKEAN